jgi:hypothetical protein
MELGNCKKIKKIKEPVEEKGSQTRNPHENKRSRAKKPEIRTKQLV